MPTGYTAKLMEKGQPFPDFVLNCARAFGALVMMRDEPSDAPIPEKFEPSDYHAKALTKAKTTLAGLIRMSPAQKDRFGRNQRAKVLADHREWLARDTAANARIDEMEAKVRAWGPPSPEHEGLKTFMLEQLKISRNDTSYIERMIREASKKTAMGYFAEAMASARRDIEYHTKAHAEEIDRAGQRTEWVRQLRASVA